MRLDPISATRNALGVALCAAFLLGATEAPKVSTPLGPGQVTGGVNSYRVAKGDTVDGIATRFAVNPVRVRQPNQQNLKDGLELNEVVYIDQRRVTPTFDPSVSGIVLNIPEAHVYFVEKGALVKDYPVGVSQADWKVPLGTTKVVLKEKNPTWHVPPKIQREMAEKGLPVKTKVPPGPKNPLGSRWIGFADGTYGFHGTLEPGSIKRYASHGCVRMLKPDLEDLFERVAVNTPVRVYYQPVKLAVDGKAIFISVYPDHYDMGYDFKGAVRQLAEQAQVADKVDWKAVDKALADRDGIFADVAITSQVVPTPKPVATASP
ncbi:putative L,D-transpeptidase YnhG precursor [compost metagenome]